MSPRHQAHAFAADREEIARPRQAADLPRETPGWCSVKRLTVELDFVTTAPGDPEEACRNWLRRHGITSVRRGRTILVSRRDVDLALRGR